MAWPPSALSREPGAPRPCPCFLPSGPQLFPGPGTLGRGLWLAWLLPPGVGPEGPVATWPEVVGGRGWGVQPALSLKTKMYKQDFGDHILNLEG